MKIITRKGLSTYFLGVEVAGLIAWIGTAIFLFCAMWIATHDLFASLFFPIWMMFLLIVMFVIEILSLLFKKK